MIGEDEAYAALRSRDGRFDGRFVVAVTTTGIYCRPSCPAALPRPDHVRFFPAAAAAQQAGYRACKRCRPDATPGSPEWNTRADVVGRAMRLIADGLVDREGVPGLAARLGYSPRQLHRQLVAEVGAGPQALARAHRARTARLLLDTTALPMDRIAYAAGFTSIRQFNHTFRQIFAVPPTHLRKTSPSTASTGPGSAARSPRRNGAGSIAGSGRASGTGSGAGNGRASGTGSAVHGTLTVRLTYRPPLSAAPLFRFLSAQAVASVEQAAPGVYRRSLHLPHGPGVITLHVPPPADPTAADPTAADPTTAGPATDPGHLRCDLHLADLADIPAAVQRCRRLLDLDADAQAVSAHLATDPLLAPLVAAAPGCRVPGHPDPFELLVRSLVPRESLLHLVERYGRPLPTPVGTVTHLFPTPEDLHSRDGDPDLLPSISALVKAIDEGVVLDPDGDRDEVERQLLAVPGVDGDHVALVRMRAMGDPDAFPGNDPVLRGLEGAAARWRPWRSYGAAHLWAAGAAGAGSTVEGE